MSASDAAPGALSGALCGSNSVPGDLSNVILQIKIMELGNPNDFLAQAITPPQPNSVSGALKNLVVRGLTL